MAWSNVINLIFEDNYKKCDGKLYYISYNNNVDVLIN
jgi:hypothetical protein